MKRRWLLALPLLALCAAKDEPRKLNIVVITADTLRGDMVHGNDEIMTPNLDRLKAQGVEFTRTYTPITTTLPAHASLFTSLYPKDHRAYSNVSALSGKVTTLPEVLKAEGWKTAAHLNMPWLTGEVSNLPQGITTARYTHIRKADRTQPWVDQWLERAAGGDPFFLWVHYVDNHTPYHAPYSYEDMYYKGGKKGPGTPMKDIWQLFPPDHRESEPFLDWVGGIDDADYLVGNYKGSVSWIDAHVGLLMHQLQELGEWDDTLFVFTADHGESLGEHDLWFVHAGLYEPTTHIPLVVRVPGGPEGERVDTVVSLVDVMPTVLAALGLEDPEGTRGMDLMPLVGSDKGGSAYLEHTGRQLEGVVTPRFKYITHLKSNTIYKGYPMNKGTEELYDLVADPMELVNLAPDHPDVVETMRAEMERLKAGERGYEEEQGAIDDEVLNALHAMGYME
jgi:arylsulfatase A-like enzyme